MNEQRGAETNAPTDGIVNVGAGEVQERAGERVRATEARDEGATEATEAKDDCATEATEERDESGAWNAGTSAPGVSVPGAALPPMARVPLSLFLAGLCLYTVWLLLPAVQVLGKAVTGVAAVGLAAAGLLLDRPFLRREWRWLTGAALVALGLPLALYFGLGRGGESLASYWCQQGMFWFGPLACAALRRRDDPRLLRVYAPVLLACVAVTALTTVAALCEGLLHDPPLAYARSLGYAGASAELHRRLMLRGVGGYDYLYGCVLSLPVCLYFASALRGKRRALAVAFLALLTLPPLLSQYLYALVFTAAVYGVWLFGLLVRAIARRAFRREMGLGAAMACALIPAALVALLRVPLSGLLVRLSQATGLRSVENGARLLYAALTGQADATAAALPSRLDAYLAPLRTLRQSPLLGRLAGGGSLGYHSDALDLLGGFGLLGAAAFVALACLPGRGLLRGLRRSPARPYAGLCLCALVAFALLNTVFYSRELSLMVSSALLFAMSDAPARAERDPGAR